MIHKVQYCSDSPTSHSKDVPTHTRAMKLKHQALQDRLERCLLELRHLCIQEAELTGKLSEDFPLKPGEKPPQIRRRVGATFKLDELSIPHKPGDSELTSVDAELALQMKIYEAARRLCDEEQMSKAVRKSRLRQCKREELKLKTLQEKAFKLRLEHGRTSPPLIYTHNAPDDTHKPIFNHVSSYSLSPEVTSQSSQLFPSVPDAPPPVPLSAPSTPRSSLRSASYVVPPTLQLTPCQSPRPSLDSTLSLNSSLALDDLPPIEHSPWSESNLDQPLDKSKKSRSSSVAPLEQCLPPAALNSQLSHLKLSRSQSNSTPSTPEMRVHRQLSLRLSGPDSPYSPEKERGRTRSARRRLTEYSISFSDPPSAAPSPSSLKAPLNYNNNTGSEDSNSDHSYSSYNSSPCHESPCELPKQYHAVYNGSYQSQMFPHNSYYLNAKSQPGPKAYYSDEMVYPAEMDMGRSYYAQPPISSRYEYWYKEPPVQQYQRGQRTPEIRLTPPQPTGGLAKQVVNEQLKSWHRRSSQLKAPRARSLDRQGAVRFKNIPSPMTREMHVYQTPPYQEQVIQRRPQRPLDDASEHWLVDDGTHYISQV
uniref:Innate immunity activator b n=1 Tax=Neogobius melanostomus TaxID=47308 RepID=A0A8C6UPE7_9GOBI